MRWLRQLWSRQRMRDDLAEEIQSHLEEKIEELVAGGTGREEAAYAAKRDFGNVTRIEERGREAWVWPLVESAWADVKFAMRQLRKSPGFAVTAMLTLAMGIGVTTAVFSVVHAVLIDPYPYKDADRMVHLHLYDKDAFPEDLALTGPQFLQFQKSPVLDGAIAEDMFSMALTGAGLPEQVQVGRVSTKAFQFFGVPALMGREFYPSDPVAALQAAHGKI